MCPLVSYYGACISILYSRQNPVLHSHSIPWYSTVMALDACSCNYIASYISLPYFHEPEWFGIPDSHEIPSTLCLNGCFMVFPKIGVYIPKSSISRWDFHGFSLTKTKNFGTTVDGNLHTVSTPVGETSPLDALLLRLVLLGPRQMSWGRGDGSFLEHQKLGEDENFAFFYPGNC